MILLELMHFTRIKIIVDGFNNVSPETDYLIIIHYVHWRNIFNQQYN